MRKLFSRLVHVLAFSLAMHVYHVATSDRMLDAAADVALDKAADVLLISAHVLGEVK